MSRRREFLKSVVPLAGALAVMPGLARAELPTLTEDDKMASTLGFRLHTEKADQTKYPKHSNDQLCAKCVHYQTPAADTARCDLFNKIVPKGGWCSGYSKRP